MNVTSFPHINLKAAPRLFENNGSFCRRLPPLTLNPSVHPFTPEDVEAESSTSEENKHKAAVIICAICTSHSPKKAPWLLPNLKYMLTFEDLKHLFVFFASRQDWCMFQRSWCSHYVLLSCWSRLFLRINGLDSKCEYAAQQQIPKIPVISPKAESLVNYRDLRRRKHTLRWERILFSCFLEPLLPHCGETVRIRKNTALKRWAERDLSLLRGVLLRCHCCQKSCLSCQDTEQSVAISWPQPWVQNKR